jgi:hypothetical protein
MNKYNTKYSSGFTNEEVKRLEGNLPFKVDLQSKLYGNTCSMEDGEPISYYHDVEQAMGRCIRMHLLNKIMEEHIIKNKSNLTSSANDYEVSKEVMSMIDSAFTAFQREQKINTII